MKIVADANIPQVAEAFQHLGEVELIPGREIRQEHLIDCQCLLVRTVTKVNQQLLEGTPVEFVGTATIGIDHIDENYLQQNKISFTNASGCNAEAASEYVISGLFALSEKRNFDPFQLKAGIIGCGNVGSRLYQKLNALGIEVLRNDPPLAKKSVGKEYVDLDTVIEQCDFLSLHVPLTLSGEHATKHLFDQERLSRLRENCLLVNAARGPVIDNEALITVIQQRPDLIVFLDTWEDEPTPSKELLASIDLATPHIAGYSVEGRLRGTQMILDAACEHFGRTSDWHMSKLLPDRIELEITPTKDDLEFWQDAFAKHHDIWVEHNALLKILKLGDDQAGAYFDSLRRVYPERFEYERYQLIGAQKKAAAIAKQLLFGVG